MLKIINPATEEIIKELAEDHTDSVVDSVKQAKEAQVSWNDVPLSERKKNIVRFRDLLIKNSESLAQTLTQEMGKPISQALNELKATPDRINFFLEYVERVLNPLTMPGAPTPFKEEVTQEPLGVIANISAWNYPYFVGSNVFIPALLTGNAVIYKPSEHATLTGLRITDLLHEAGIPSNLFITLIGGGKVGAEIVKQPIDGVFFTGSVATGRKIAESAAQNFIRVQLELGGKDPVYVCEDVDVASVASGTADGAFYNTGQSCCAVERIYVHEKVFDEFVKKFLHEVKGFAVGDPTNPKTYIGPLARGAHLSEIKNQVEDAVKKGARILCGGERRAGKGYFYEPTVLIDVNHSMDVMKQETFGPVIGIQKVQSDDEALSLMNDTAYGLTASVYTPNLSRARSLLSRVKSGSVYWNCCDRVSPRLPWTGRKHSGFGATLGIAGISSFLAPKAWHLKPISP